MQISPHYHPRSDKYSDTSGLLSSLWPPCHSLGQILPTMKFLRVTESRVWPARQHLWASMKAGVRSGGLPWALGPTLCWWPGYSLDFGVSRVVELSPLASLQKWIGKNRWFAKQNNPQVDRVLEKSADCSREIIESMWMMTEVLSKKVSLNMKTHL